MKARETEFVLSMMTRSRDCHCGGIICSSSGGWYKCNSCGDTYQVALKPDAPCEEPDESRQPVATEPRKVEWVAVERPESFVCPNCGEDIECRVARGDWMPHCYKCGTHFVLRFSEPIKAIAWEEAQDGDAPCEEPDDAKTIAELEAKLEDSVNARAEYGTGWPIPVMCLRPGMYPWVIDGRGDIQCWAESKATADAIVSAMESRFEANDDAKTIADLQGKVNDKNEFILRLEAENAALEAEVGNLQADLAFVKSESRSELKTLSETIMEKTRKLAEFDSRHDFDVKTIDELHRQIGVIRADRDRIDATCGHAITAMESAGKRLAELKAAPAPPADSREAFKAWAVMQCHYANGGNLRDDHLTSTARKAWLAGVAWERSRKPGKIAEVVEIGSRDLWGVEVCGVEVRISMTKSRASKLMDTVNAAYEKENTDGD